MSPIPPRQDDTDEDTEPGRVVAIPLITAAEYPSALWIPADPTNYRADNRATASLVITHITDGHGDPVAVAKMWQVPHHGSSAHFVIGQDGTVIQCVRLADIAWAAHAANALSWNIEHCARSARELGPTDPGLPISTEQYIASSKLQAFLVARAKLQPIRAVLVGHAEIDKATTHADCPTGQWSWDAFMPLVQAEYAALTP